MFTHLKQYLERIPPGLLALLPIALAFFLRAYRLPDKNLWWDEGWTIWLSRHDLAAIALRTAGDEHPPLHYWLMHFWNLAAGTDAFAGRFFSLFFGILMVAVLYRIGRLIGGKWLGLVSALLLAISRFHIWWSQDIKNYTLSSLFALASIWFLLRVLAGNGKPGSRTLCFGYVVTAALALYSHYLAALVLLAENLLVLSFLLRESMAGRSPRPLLFRWAGAQLAVLALFAPWLWLYLGQAATWQAAPPFDFGLFLRLAATVLPLGVTTYIDNYAATVAALSLIALASAGWLLVRRGPRDAAILRWGAALALVLVAVPPLLIYILSLTPAAFFAPKIQARYLLILLPGYVLLLALGIRLLARRARILGAAALLLVTLALGSTLGDYYGERVTRDDYATLAQVVSSFALPGDAIVLHTDQEWPTFLAYLDPRREWNLVFVPNGTRVDDAVAQRVAAQAGQYQGIWLVTIPDALEKDPSRRVETALAGRWPRLYEAAFGDKRLALYSDRTHNLKDVPPENFHPLQTRSDPLGNQLRLVGLDLPARELAPGDTLRVVSYWESLDLATIKTRLASPGAAATLALERETPISIGAHERVQADFLIPPGAAGPYVLTAEARGQTLVLGTIDILPPQPLGRAARPNGAGLTRPLEYRLGDSIHLLGYDLQDGPIHPGDTVPLTLFWQTDAPLETSYSVFVHLVGSQYNPAQGNPLWGQVDSRPVEGTLPTTAWPPGQTIADPYFIPAARNAPPGQYQIEVGLYDAGGTRLPVFDREGKAAGDSIILTSIEIN